MKPDFWFSFFHQFAETVIRRRRAILACLAVLFIFCAFPIRNIRIDNSHEVWFIEGDRSLELTDKFKGLFGDNDDSIFLLSEPRQGVTAETIRLTGQLAEELEASMPYLLDVTWLGTAEIIEGGGGEIQVTPLMREYPATEEDVSRLLERARNDPAQLNRLISGEGTVLGIILEIDQYPEDEIDPQKNLAPELQKVLQKPEYKELRFQAVGTPILHATFDRIVAREIVLFFILCLIANMAVLTLFGRGWRAAAAASCVIVTCLVITGGVIALAGSTLNLAFIFVPTLIFCVAIGDSLHVISEYHDQRDKGVPGESAILKGVGRIGLACLLTSITTAIGFLSFLSVSIRPLQEMGVYSAFAVFLAFVLTLLIVPTFYAKGHPDIHAGKKRRPSGRVDRVARLHNLLYRFVVHHPGKIVLFFLLMMAVSLFGWRLIQVETNTVNNLLGRVPIRQAYDLADERMGGSMSLEIMIDTGNEEGIYDPRFLGQLERYQTFIEGMANTTRTESVVNILKRINQAVHDDDPEEMRIPETSDEIAQHLLIYEVADGKYLDRLVSFQYDIARVRVQTRKMDTGDMRQFADRVESEAAAIFDPHIKVELTGKLAWLLAMNDLVKQGQRKSMLIAFSLITVMMIAVMRSVGLGLISMVPNVFPVFITMGLIGFSGMYMDIHVMASSAIIIGVAVDDTIHFFTRYKTEFTRSGNYEGALRETLLTVGRPITFTTLVLLTGLCLLGFSSVLGVVKFGLLSGFAFLWALISDFLFAPALILLLKPLGPDRSILKESTDE